MERNGVEVVAVTSRAEQRAFWELPYLLYARDPNWVAPLRAMERRRWMPRHNASLRTRRVRRFLARHKEASFYADFPDFAFWRLAVEGAHYIGGFGRIFDLGPSDLLLPLQGAEALLEGEPGIVEHMNADHADALELYATSLAGASPGSWRMVGIDPEGCDIVLEGQARRIVFATPIATPAEARKELVRLAAEARARLQEP